MNKDIEERNKSRSRYYGKRIGDIVIPEFAKNSETKEFEVVGYGGMDNNRIYIRNCLGDVFSSPAEECNIVKRIEESKKEKKDIGIVALNLSGSSIMLNDALDKLQKVLQDGAKIIRADILQDKVVYIVEK